MAGYYDLETRDVSKGMFVYTTPDEIPRHLKYRVVDTGVEPFRFWFKHPFCNQMFPVALPMPIERFLKEREERANRHLASRDFRSWVFMHERPWRRESLQRIVHENLVDVSDPDQTVAWWKLVADVWVDTEFNHNDLEWSIILDAQIPDKEKMTNERDWAQLYDLAQENKGQLVVYRGIRTHDEDNLPDHLNGWSWTLDPEVATFFAKRFETEDTFGVILKTSIPVEKVEAYLTERGEEEVLVRPGTIALGDMEKRRIK